MEEKPEDEEISPQIEMNTCKHNDPPGITHATHASQSTVENCRSGMEIKSATIKFDKLLRIT